MEKRILTVSYITQRGVTSPFIRIRGQWLSAAGFNIKDKIVVQIVEPGVMVIERVEPKDDRRRR